jgi:hypothetical protein
VDVAVFGAVEVALLVLGGAAIAVLAAIVPAGWAAGCAPRRRYAPSESVERRLSNRASLFRMVR